MKITNSSIIAAFSYELKYSQDKSLPVVLAQLERRMVIDLSESLLGCGNNDFRRTLRSYERTLMSDNGMVGFQSKPVDERSSDDCETLSTNSSETCVTVNGGVTIYMAEKDDNKFYFVDDVAREQTLEQIRYGIQLDKFTDYDVGIIKLHYKGARLVGPNTDNLGIKEGTKADDEARGLTIFGIILIIIGILAAIFTALFFAKRKTSRRSKSITFRGMDDATEGSRLSDELSPPSSPERSSVTSSQKRSSVTSSSPLSVYLQKLDLTNRITSSISGMFPSTHRSKNSSSSHESRNGNSSFHFNEEEPDILYPEDGNSASAILFSPHQKINPSSSHESTSARLDDKKYEISQLRKEENSTSTHIRSPQQSITSSSSDEVKNRYACTDEEEIEILRPQNETNCTSAYSNVVGEENLSGEFIVDDLQMEEERLGYSVSSQTSSNAGLRASKNSSPSRKFNNSIDVHPCQSATCCLCAEPDINDPKFIKLNESSTVVGRNKWNMTGKRLHKANDTVEL